jgi:hypothetical protein
VGVTLSQVSDLQKQGVNHDGSVKITGEVFKWHIPASGQFSYFTL